MKKAIVKYYRIKSDKIAPSDFPIRIVFISDLHNVSIGEQNKLLLNKIDSLAPDLVLLGGDTIIGKPNKAMDTGLDFIKALGEKYPLCVANGNHEYRLKIYPETYGDMYEQYLEAIEKAGVTLLSNKSVTISSKDTSITIHGLELDRKYYSRFKKQGLSVTDVEDYLGSIDDDKYHILLAHNPRYGKTYMDWGADLTLAGH